VNNQVLENALRATVLDMNSSRVAGIKAFHRTTKDSQTKSNVEHFDRLKF
jgi:hypothetical protein